MIVVDASALLAIYLAEPERAVFTAKLEEAEEAVMSPVNYWEAMVRARALAGQEGAAELTTLIASLGIELVAIDAEIAELAIEASVSYAQAPARLNLGDCFASALARSRNAPLLFKGNDFAATDVVAA